eukprot:4343778-Lingulodinium_polyedra.AAC.1
MSASTALFMPSSPGAFSSMCCSRHRTARRSSRRKALMCRTCSSQSGACPPGAVATMPTMGLSGAST